MAAKKQKADVARAEKALVLINRLIACAQKPKRKRVFMDGPGRIAVLSLDDAAGDVFKAITGMNPDGWIERAPKRKGGA